MAKRREFGRVRQLPSGRWQARYPLDDGALTAAPNTFETKREAVQYLDRVSTDMQRGEWTDPRLGLITFGRWSQQWIAGRANLRPSTRSLYDVLLRHELLPAFGDIELARIDPAAVRAWFAGPHGKRGPTTVAKAYRLLSAILRSAFEDGRIARNPCSLKGAGREARTEAQFLTVDDVAGLAETVGRRWRALVLTAAYTGLRWGELMGLRRSRVDLLRGTIAVVEQLTEVDGALSFAALKTDASRRTIALPQFVLEELIHHINTYAEAGPNGLVFPAPEGGPMRRSNFTRRVWIPARTELGFDGVRFHDLRHTAAAVAIASGAANPLVLSRRLGHSTTRMTFDRYGHLFEGADRALAEALDGLGRTARYEPIPKPIPISKGHAGGTKHARRRAV